MKMQTHRILMQTALPLLLLAALLYNSFGYFVVYQVNRSKVKSEMRKKMAAKGVQVLVLEIVNADKDPSFRRIDTREVEFNNQLFDIVCELKKGITTTFYCIRDTREEILMDGMRKAARTKFTQNLVSNLITIAMPVLAGDSHIDSYCNITFPPVKFRLMSHPADPQSPPPELT